MASDLTTTKLSPAKQALLERMRKKTALTVAPVIVRREARTRAPLSFAQQRMWVMQQFDPESHLYNVPRALTIRGPLNVAALEQALNSIIQRHEILRTTFPADENGQPWQNIAAELKLSLPFTDLSALAAAERDQLLRTSQQKFWREVFDL